MRSVGLSDLDAAARALLVLPRGDWDACASALIEEAHVADLWRKRYGTAHTGGGTGSLYVQATLQARVASSECTAQYCAAFEVVLHALSAWRKRADQKM